MKIGIFADVHGNIYAFEKIWKALIREKCDIICFVGDICGYYYYQKEIINMIREVSNLIYVAGNHDAMFLRALEDENFENEYAIKYGLAGKVLKEKISTEEIQFLKNMPHYHIIKEYNIALFHGSPWNYLNDYVYPDTNLDKFTTLPYHYAFLGNTHYPMCKALNNVTIINPGSCGQPRDYNWPSYTILDYKTGMVKFKRIQYDIKSLIKDIKKYRETNSYLVAVLKRMKSE